METDLGKLFIGGISWDTDEERLNEYFGTYGEVVEAVIMRDRAAGRARGFGFIIFADQKDAERVVMEKRMIDGRTVSTFISQISFSITRFQSKESIKRWRFGEREGVSKQVKTRRIYLEDLMKFLREDEAHKTISLFEGESGRLRPGWERRVLALSLGDTAAAVNKLHHMLNGAVAIATLVISLLIFKITRGNFFIVLGSQLLLVGFMFGNTCKTTFKSIINVVALAVYRIRGGVYYATIGIFVSLCRAMPLIVFGRR